MSDQLIINLQVNNWARTIALVAKMYMLERAIEKTQDDGDTWWYDTAAWQDVETAFGSDERPQ